MYYIVQHGIYPRESHYAKIDMIIEFSFHSYRYICTNTYTITHKKNRLYYIHIYHHRCWGFVHPIKIIITKSEFSIFRHHHHQQSFKVFKFPGRHTLFLILRKTNHHEYFHKNHLSSIHMHWDRLYVLYEHNKKIYQNK